MLQIHCDFRRTLGTKRLPIHAPLRFTLALGTEFFLYCLANMLIHTSEWWRTCAGSAVVIAVSQYGWTGACEWVSNYRLKLSARVPVVLGEPHWYLSQMRERLYLKANSIKILSGRHCLWTCAIIEGFGGTALRGITRIRTHPEQL